MEAVTSLAASSSTVAEAQPTATQASVPTPVADEPYQDREPNFWSLDNPLVATAAGLGAFAVLSIVLHGP